MGKRDALIPSLAALISNARPLQKFSRANAAEVNIHRRWTRRGNVQIAPREENSKVNAIIANHKVLEKFFSDLGFPPLAKKHVLMRHWDSQIAHVRKEEERMVKKKERKRRASQFKKGKDKSQTATVAIDSPGRKIKDENSPNT